MRFARAAESFVKSQLPQDAQCGQRDGRDPGFAACGSSTAPAACTARLPPGAHLLARTMVGVACDGPVHWIVYVPVTVESRISVLVLKHPVPRDARLTAEDVTVESRKVTGLATAFLTDVSDLQARYRGRPLPMGTTLTMDMFKADLVIKHGQDVTLIASAGGIEVRASRTGPGGCCRWHTRQSTESELPESRGGSGRRTRLGAGGAMMPHVSVI